MPIQVEKRDGSADRAVLCGMVLSRQVLAAVAPKWGRGLLSSRVGQIVGGWCVAHFEKYRKAPGQSIKSYFDRWAESNKDREAANDVAAFLEGLSAESARLKAAYSPDHVIDLAGVLFNRVKIQGIRDELGADLERGDVSGALERLEGFHRVELGLGSGIDVLTDDAAWGRVLNRRREPLIDLPDGLREFYEDDLSRDSFVAWFAPFKRGKSFCIQDLAWRCVEQGVPVAYFECGDSSEPQVLERWGARMMGRPLSAGPRNLVEVRRPISIGTREKGDRTLAEIEWEDPKYYRQDVTEDELRDAREQWVQTVGPNTFKMSCHAAGNLSVAGAHQILEQWERDTGFVPGAIFFDYADLLAPPPGVKEPRDQHSENWKALRGMSQSKHALVGTVTQTNAKSQEAWLLSRKHFAEDLRKFAHVTAFYGLNQGDEEGLVGAYRLNCLLNRFRSVDPEKCCFCIGSLACGDPFAVSAF